MSEIIKYVLVASVVLLFLSRVDWLCERLLWRVDCALNVPSACAGIEEVRAADWATWTRKGK